jgi:phosphoserine phosphatase
MRAHIFDMDGTLLRRTSAPVLLANIREVLADVHTRAERACLITMSPDYFAEQFLEFGFDAVFASRFPRSPEAALDESTILNPEDKPRLAARFCTEHGLEMQDAVAYGDSMSDVFLFKEVGLRVSVNGDHHLAELADIAVEGPDLMLAYRAARERCDRPANPPPRAPSS